jgi:hypothetical protein
MKKIFYYIPLLLVCFSCNNQDKKETGPETDINVITNFIQAALKGNYEEAKRFMISDSMSLQRMNNIARVNLSAEEKKGLAGASINIHRRIPVNDSTTIFIYSNSFKNNRDTLRAMRMQGKWLVDFNYLFDHDMDSLMSNPVVNKPDSIQ